MFVCMLLPRVPVLSLYTTVQYRQKRVNMARLKRPTDTVYYETLVRIGKVATSITHDRPLSFVMCLVQLQWSTSRTIATSFHRLHTLCSAAAIQYRALRDYNMKTLVPSILLLLVSCCHI